MLLEEIECRSLLRMLNRKKHLESLNLLGANGGKVPYGAVGKLIKSYHANGYKAVTRKNLYYHLSQTKRKTPLAMSISVTSHAQVSDLSGKTNTTNLAVASANIYRIINLLMSLLALYAMLGVKGKAPQRKLQRKE
jgi:hypothetical protein